MQFFRYKNKLVDYGGRLINMVYLVSGTFYNKGHEYNSNVYKTPGYIFQRLQLISWLSDRKLKWENYMSQTSYRHIIETKTEQKKRTAYPGFESTWLPAHSWVSGETPRLLVWTVGRRSTEIWCLFKCLIWQYISSRDVMGVGGLVDPPLTYATTPCDVDLATVLGVCRQRNTYWVTTC